jgi:hypothetical protein
MKTQKSGKSEESKENRSDQIIKTKIHGYLKHVVPKTLQGRHPYQVVDFKKQFQSEHITTPISDQIISKMKSRWFRVPFYPGRALDWIPNL